MLRSSVLARGRLAAAASRSKVRVPNNRSFNIFAYHSNTQKICHIRENVKINMFATAARYTRIFFLCGQLFYAGSQKEPAITVEHSLEDTPDRLGPFHQFQKLYHTFERFKQQYRVNKVSEKILEASKAYVDQQFQEAVQRALERLPDDASINDDAACSRWEGRMNAIKGKWIFEITNDSTGAGPIRSDPSQSRHIYINMKMASELNDDELAMMIGHEVAHVTNNDFSDHSGLDGSLCLTEIMLLAVSRTRGLKTLGFMAGLAIFRQMIYSRELLNQELDADVLGQHLAHLASYNVERGAQVPFKLAAAVEEEKDEDMNLDWSRSFWEISPSPEKRQSEMLKHYEKDAPERRPNRYCAGAQQRLHSLAQLPEKLAKDWIYALINSDRTMKMMNKINSLQQQENVEHYGKQKS